MVVVIVVAGFALALVVAMVFVRAAARRANARLDSRLEGVVVLRRDKANFFGLASAGAAQLRGLGILALTPDELVFAQLIPDREVRVPRAAVSDVRTARSYLGKTQGRDLLVVTWPDDEAAWDVPNLSAWMEDLRRPDQAG